MNYVFCKNQNLQLDLMVEEAFYPQMVSYIQRMGCRYREERAVTPRKGRIYHVLKDITGPNDAAVGEVIGLFYSLEWGSLLRGEERKFYIMVNPRRKGKKKHADKNRKKADQGSNCGDRGEPAGNSGSEPLGGSAGDGPDAGVIGADDLWELPRVE